MNGTGYPLPGECLVIKYFGDSEAHIPPDQNLAQQLANSPDATFECDAAGCHNAIMQSTGNPDTASFAGGCVLRGKARPGKNTERDEPTTP